MLLVWLRVNDIRVKYKLARSLVALTNEWGKALVAAVLAYLVAMITQAGPNPSIERTAAGKPAAAAHVER